MRWLQLFQFFHPWNSHPDESCQTKSEKWNPASYLWSEADNRRCHRHPSTGMWSRAKDLKRTSKILLKAIKCFSNFGFSSVFLTEKEQMGTEVNSCHLERLKDQYEKSQVSSLFITSPALSIINIKTLSEQGLNYTKDKWFCKAIFSVSFYHLIVQLSWKLQFWTEKGKKLVGSFTSYAIGNCLSWSFPPSIEHCSLDSA